VTNNEVNKQFETYSADVWRLCQSLCFNYQDSEDLFQETFIKAYVKIDTYNPNLDFRKWIFSICYNTFKNLLRKNSFRPINIEFVNNEEKDNLINNIIEKDIEKNIFWDIVNAVKSLPPKLKAVVVFFYFDDFSVKEISDILKTPVYTVKNRLYKARIKLKERLVDYG